MELTITKDRVLAVANSSEAADKMMRALFPEVFDKSVKVDTDAIVIDGKIGMEQRVNGEYTGKAFYLNEDHFNWEMKKDRAGMLVLIPTKKQL